ncbi:MAG TPA: PEP-CTERM sorting domain-containing protein [Phycisphaerales bacterium]|nr:PEP-CTERM sorting domain-containing protein [Phycisphaerales bacterium]
MRASVSILAVLLLASQAIATVVLTSRDLGGGIAELSYDASQEASLVRAFALDITVSPGIIISTDNWSSDYWVYPSQIIIDPETGEIIDSSTPIASPDFPGTLGGLGTSGITIEMGSLYDEADPIHNTPPPVSGVLLTFTVSAECDVAVTENLVRGGVILEDGTETDIYAPTTHIIPEPATVLLLGLGGVALLRKRKRN